MYLTYAEYQQMGGTLDETTFNDYEFEAEVLVNWFTFNRLKGDTTFPEELKRLMKYLVTLAKEKADVQSSSGAEGESGGKSIASQSNDGVSVSYNVLSAKDLMQSIAGEGEKAIQTYLQGVTNEAGKKLLYRGLYKGE